MTDTSYAYGQAKFIIHANARKQAKADAMNTPLLKAMEHVNNPSIILDAYDSLREWAKSTDAKVLFTGLDQDLYYALTNEERVDLVHYWCTVYPPLVVTFLKQKLSGELA